MLYYSLAPKKHKYKCSEGSVAANNTVLNVVKEL